MVFKDTILKAIHNREQIEHELTQLRMVFKDTILKAIHNTNQRANHLLFAANGL